MNIITILYKIYLFLAHCQNQFEDVAPQHSEDENQSSDRGRQEAEDQEEETADRGVLNNAAAGHQNPVAQPNNVATKPNHTRPAENAATIRAPPILR